MRCFDVVVIGAGIVGLTAALGLTKRNLHVALIEKHSLEIDSVKLDDRIYAINQTSKELFENLGVWKKIPVNRLAAYQHMHIWDDASPGIIDFDSRMIATDNLGFIIEESILRAALLNQLRLQPKVKLFAYHSVIDIANVSDIVQITTEKCKLTAHFMIISDGANSHCRQLLQIPLTTWSYHQQALVATVTTEYNHQQTAYQVFNATGSLAFLPRAQATECSIVWSTNYAHMQQLMSLSEQDFSQYLTEVFAHKLGKIQITSQRHQFPLMMRLARRLVGESLVLAGDAAHTVHPLAGLGLNLGLADLIDLFECFSSSEDKFPNKQNLMAYQRRRHYIIWKNILFLEGIKAMFINPLLPMRALRGLGMRMCNQTPLLKRLFIRRATNLS